MSRFMTTMFQPIRFIAQSLTSTAQKSNEIAGSLVKPDSFLVSLVRNKVRCYFPRPNEVRRVRRHGWNTRISTPNGRRIIMRRILKGRFVLTH